jgi:uncharacterized protein (DUF2062 family)
MATRAPTLWMRAVAWCRRNLPTRESMEKSKLLRPVAHRVLAPELWRFTRRSVPRGVALGMITGILFPVAQIAFSAVLALPIRANVPVASLVTFISNPLTTPFIWAAAYWLGKWALHLDAVVPGQPVREAAQLGWAQWLVSDAAPALALGLLILSVAMAVLGYALAAIGWRVWIARKWRNRRG